jgi:hypothetical protein
MTTSCASRPPGEIEEACEDVGANAPAADDHQRAVLGASDGRLRLEGR